MVHGLYLPAGFSGLRVRPKAEGGSAVPKGRFPFGGRGGGKSAQPQRKAEGVRETVKRDCIERMGVIIYGKPEQRLRFCAF